MDTVDRIERIGPLEIATSPDGRRVVAIALSAAPSTLWRQSFRYGRARPPVCYPDLVRISGQTLEFTSAERDVSAWVECIDSWIDDANWRCADYHTSPYWHTAPYQRLGP